MEEEKKIPKEYVTCIRCKRDFQLFRNEEKTKYWGQCPICKIVYDVVLKEEKE